MFSASVVDEGVRTPCFTPSVWHAIPLPLKPEGWCVSWDPPARCLMESSAKSLGGGPTCPFQYSIPPNFEYWVPRSVSSVMQVPAGMPRRPCKGFRAVWFSPRAGPRFLYVLALRDHGFFFRFRVRGPLGREGSRWCRSRMRKQISERQYVISKRSMLREIGGWVHPHYYIYI